MEKSPKIYTRHIGQLQLPSIVSEFNRFVVAQERRLMEEGIKTFAEPQHAMLRFIARKRTSANGL